MHASAKTDRQFFKRHGDPAPAQVTPIAAELAPRMTIADLQAARASLGMTREALSAVLGFSKRYIEELEAGRKPIPRYLRLAVRALLDGHR
jgi:DNA-binding transcriptional regulator YiaG